jgi:hypothetical protein
MISHIILTITSSKERGNNMHLSIYQEHNKGSDLINHSIKLRIHHIGISYNHDRKLIWHLINIGQERDRSSYCHKPIVQRWTTPSSSWWWCLYCWRGSRCDRGWLRQRFLLQSSQFQPIFRGFVFLRHLLARTPLGVCNIPRFYQILG